MLVDVNGQRVDGLMSPASAQALVAAAGRPVRLSMRRPTKLPSLRQGQVDVLDSPDNTPEKSVPARSTNRDQRQLGKRAIFPVGTLRSSRRLAPIPSGLPDADCTASRGMGTQRSLPLPSEVSLQTALSFDRPLRPALSFDRVVDRETRLDHAWANRRKSLRQAVRAKNGGQ